MVDLLLGTSTVNAFYNRKPILGDRLLGISTVDAFYNRKSIFGGHITRN